MQVDPIKPMLNALEVDLLKLNYDELLSNFAFKFDLRRYNLDHTLLNSATFGEVETTQEETLLAALTRSEAGAYPRPLFSST